jgi:hypothetical protein
MTDEPKGFLHIDLTKLTLVGWLIMLLTIAMVLGVTVGLAFLLQAAGLALETPEGQRRRWVMGLCLLAGVGAGAGFFQASRRLCRSLGLPFLRGSDQ